MTTFTIIIEVREDGQADVQTSMEVSDETDKLEAPILENLAEEVALMADYWFQENYFPTKAINQPTIH